MAESLLCLSHQHCLLFCLHVYFSSDLIVPLELLEGFLVDNFKVTICINVLQANLLLPLFTLCLRIEKISFMCLIILNNAFKKRTILVLLELQAVYPFNTHLLYDCLIVDHVVVDPLVLQVSTLLIKCFIPFLHVLAAVLHDVTLVLQIHGFLVHSVVLLSFHGALLLLKHGFLLHLHVEFLLTL